MSECGWGVGVWAGGVGGLARGEGARYVFCRLKDLCDACVSVFLLEVFCIFKSVVIPGRAGPVSVVIPGWVTRAGS